MNVEFIKNPIFRLAIVFSVFWVIITILIVTSISNTYWRFSDYAVPIFLITIPVWAFWSAFWIWPQKFFNLFNLEKNQLIKENSINEILKKTWVTKKHLLKTPGFIGLIILLVGLIGQLRGIKYAYILFPISAIFLMYALSKKFLD